MQNRKEIDRNISIDILKGIGILSMIIGHSNFGSITEIYIAGFHMQLFFIISGLFFSPDKYLLVDFLKRKAKSLLLPYFSFALITIFLCLIVNWIRGEELYPIENILKGIVFSNRAIFPITGALWFLQCLFFAELFFFFIVKIKNKVILMILLGFIASLSYWQSISNVWFPFAIDSALSAVVFIGVGYLFKSYMNKINISKNQILSWAIIILFISLITIFYNGQVNPRICTYGNIYLFFFNAIIGTIGWYLFSAYLFKSKFEYYSFLSYIGRNSIIYLGLNQLIILALYHIFNLMYNFDYFILKAVRNIAICFLTTIMLYYISILFNKSRLKILIGKF
ncbi:acyltransferase family protein [Parabacteroides timonensis]|uniref:acyltransferase family protein n=1 Tax=Parabacteroides timonensis TaxID=1871013 RepID=UPI00094F0D28|nr:acyltransferase family protein [Parabacteroides timonensis]